MPFVSDIAGPQRPVEVKAPLVTGAVRRTSTIDTHSAGSGRSDVDLRARDVTATPDGVTVLDEIGLRAHLADRTVERLDATPPDGRLIALVGHRVGPGFRATVAGLVPDDVARSSLLHLLLDDWVGAALVSGYAVQHMAITAGVEEQLPPGTADRMAGICAGFALDASLVGYARQHGTIPSVHGPVAPPLGPAGMHDVAPLRPHGMRRMRRLDLRPVDGVIADFDAHFRDSHVDGDGVETIVHEYFVTGSVDTPSRTIASVTAHVAVLPWQECPGAIGSAARIRGMTLRDLRERIRTEFVGTTTCTHLNDTLRAVADLDALFDLQS